MKTASSKILGLIIILAIGIAIGWFLKPNKNQLVEKNVYTTKRDTILDTVYLARKPIFIYRKADIIYRTDIDTIVQTKSFLAKLDTITARDDTLNLKYLFPENRFELMIRQSKDTLFNKTYTNTITETKIEKIERPLWLDILSHVGAFLGGFLFGNINNK